MWSNEGKFARRRLSLVLQKETPKGTKGSSERADVNGAMSAADTSAEETALDKKTQPSNVTFEVGQTLSSTHLETPYA